MTEAAPASKGASPNDTKRFSLEKLPDVCIGTGKALCAEEEREKA